MVFKHTVRACCVLCLPLTKRLGVAEVKDGDGVGEAIRSAAQICGCLEDQRWRPACRAPSSPKAKDVGPTLGTSFPTPPAFSPRHRVSRTLRKEGRQ